MTNFEAIMQMTVEQVATLFAAIKGKTLVGAEALVYYQCSFDEEIAKFEEWLKQEVSEDAAD